MSGVWFEVYIDLEKLTKEEWKQLNALVKKAAVDDD